MPNPIAASTLSADVCVIGGGPAGATLARRLAQLGHSVVVAEKHSFPRSHVGESLVGGVLPLLDVLEIRNEIENAGFLRPESALVRWTGPVERRVTPGEPGFQVDRGRFDEILLAAAAEAGARVFQPARAVSIQRRGAADWLSTIRLGVADITVKSRFVADATGRRGLLGGTKRRISEQTLALYAYWKCPPVHNADTRVEAGEDAWYWGAPLPGGVFNATVFIDSSNYREFVSRAGSRDACYENLIARSELLAECLRGVRTGPVRACDATQRCDEMPATSDTIKVGEAAFSIDPLSSQGVQAAIGTALHAAAVIHTILERPGETELALGFYRTRQLESVELHRMAAGTFYREAARIKPREFWSRRAIDPSFAESEAPRDGRPALSAHLEIELAPETRFETISTIQRDFIAPANAVVFPGLQRPIVFLDEIEVAPLAAMIRGPMTVERLLDAWSQRMSPDRAIQLLRWLWDAGVVRRAESSTSSNRAASSYQNLILE
jgi:flavin-dependent dehydrogenase